MITVEIFNTNEFAKFIKGKISDMEERLRFFSGKLNNHKSYYVTLINTDTEKIIGICKIAPYTNDKSDITISYCSIDREYWGGGLLNKLIEGVVLFCKDNGLTLGSSRWTVVGSVKLRPTILKWCDKYDVIFNDHDKKFDYSHNYNSDMVSVEDMTSTEREEHRKLGNIEPPKGYRKLFYNTGVYKIYSTQTSYDKDKVNSIFYDISNSKYEYFSDNGKIAGYSYRGKYYITEGHHRILAALKYWKKYRDYKPVDKLIKNGNFEEKNPNFISKFKFPKKMMENLKSFFEFNR